jgi:hypothetical protein
MSAACERCGTAEREVNFCDAVDAWLCLRCAEPYLPTVPEVEEFPQESYCPDPFARPLDRLLAGLRRHSPDAYRLIPGEHGLPDRWLAHCPLHVSTGHSMALLERADGDVVLACAAGCPECVIRELLDPDTERERIAAARAAVLLWAQSYGKRAA